MSAQAESGAGHKTVVAMPAGPMQTSGAARPAAASGSYSAFVPLLLFGLAVLAVLAWQLVLLGSEREALNAAHAGQQQTVDNAGKLRASLDALAADTQRLADGGNASAAALVAELRKRGITINPQAAVAAGSAAAR